MRFILMAAALAFGALSSTAYAAEYIHEVKREPVTAIGNSQEVAKRAVRCIAINTQMEPNPFLDIDSGLVVATSTVNGRLFKLGGQQQVIKSKLTVEARDSKFRITHSEILVSYITANERAKYEFKPVPDNSKASKDVADALASSDEKLSSCISNSADDF